VVATQEKEQFGTLRFACNLTKDDQRIAGTVEIACAMSMLICEICGSSGTLIQDGGWIRTRCAEHHEQQTLNANHSIEIFSYSDWLMLTIKQ